MSSVFDKIKKVKIISIIILQLFNFEYCHCNKSCSDYFTINSFNYFYVNLFSYIVFVHSYKIWSSHNILTDIILGATPALWVTNTLFTVIFTHFPREILRKMNIFLLNKQGDVQNLLHKMTLHFSLAVVCTAYLLCLFSIWSSKYEYFR